MKFYLHAYIVSYDNLDNWGVAYLFVGYFLFSFFAVHLERHGQKVLGKPALKKVKMKQKAGLRFWKKQEKAV